MDMRETVLDTVTRTYSAYVDDALIRKYNNTSAKQAKNRRNELFFHQVKNYPTSSYSSSILTFLFMISLFIQSSIITTPIIFIN